VQPSRQDIPTVGPVRPLRRAEYDKLVSMGAFADERVELLYGQLVTMTPQGTAHSYPMRALNKLLVQRLGDRASVQVQQPVAASDESEPEPDLAVVPPGDYLDDHPSQCHLVIEIADSSRAKDLGPKARLYAEMGVPDYWVVDLERRALVVHRGPAVDRYQDIRTLAGGEIALLAFPDVGVRVDDVLPPR
jgi:Uma2 family endonuclease